MCGGDEGFDSPERMFAGIEVARAKVERAVEGRQPGEGLYLVGELDQRISCRHAPFARPSVETHAPLRAPLAGPEWGQSRGVRRDMDGKSSKPVHPDALGRQRISRREPASERHSSNAIGIRAGQGEPPDPRPDHEARPEREFELVATVAERVKRPSSRNPAKRFQVTDEIAHTS